MIFWDLVPFILIIRNVPKFQRSLLPLSSGQKKNVPNFVKVHYHTQFHGTDLDNAVPSLPPKSPSDLAAHHSVLPLCNSYVILQTVSFI